MIALWNEKYATGIDAIDAEHRTLFDAINSLHGMLRDGQAGAAAQRDLRFILNYSRDHFAREERLMEEFGCPGLAEHQTAHEQLLGRMGDLVGKVAAGEPFSTATTAFLTHWLTGHIRVEDQVYALFIRKKKARRATA